MPAVSIVIAAYNVAPYIRQALNSACGQTLRDIEIVCVDDASTDGTADILAQYAARDGRIKAVYHAQNGGLSATRYDGICAAAGEYLLFLDGDDYLQPEACEKAYAAARAAEVDVLHFRFGFLRTGATSQQAVDDWERVGRPYAQALPRTRGALVNACYVERRFCWNLAGKLLRRTVVLRAYRHYGGQRITMAEDLLFFFMTAVYASGYAPLDEALYIYRLGSGVTSQGELSLQRFAAFVDEYEVYALLCEWLRLEGEWGRYAPAAECVRRIVFGDMACAFLARLPAAACPQALELARARWPMEDLVQALAAGAYVQHLASPAELAWRCRSLVLPGRGGRVRTVAAFYYRLRNGGVEKVIAQLAPIWQAMGCRVLLLTEEPPHPQDYPLPQGVERRVLPLLDSPPTFESIQRRVAAWFEILKEYEVDALVYHAYRYPCLPMDTLAAAALGVPTAAYIHGPAGVALSSDQLSHLQTAAAQQKQYSLANTILALSEVDRAWWQALGLHSELVLNPPPFDIRAVTPAAAPAGPEVLWVGRITAFQKQPLEALRIMRRVHAALPQARLRFVGEPDTPQDEQALTDYIDAHDMGSYVTLEGFHKDVTPFYRQAALVLWTALLEGAPVAMVEAQSFGLPIVTYDLPNVELVRRGAGMCVVPQGDTAAAAAQVIRLLQDEPARQALGAAARASVCQLYAEDMSAQWQRLFEGMCAPPAVGAPAPLEQAVRMSLEFLAIGLSGLHDDDDETQALRRQNADYAAMVREITSSASWRAGRLITAPLRWLKRLLHR